MKCFALLSLITSKALADFECRTNVCGCPSSYKQSWCSQENSLITSEWCNGETARCENNCGGIACATTMDDKNSVASISTYPGYAGPKTVTGTVEVMAKENGIQMFGTLVGLEPLGTGGIHIHTGTSCTTSADPMGHYFEGMASDPWTTTYTSDAAGAATINFDVAVFTLNGDFPTAGRTIVVHDPDGTRIGCGVIGNVTTEPSTECHIAVCGCPGSFLLPWCSVTTSFITSEWCNEDSSQCKKCGGTYCTIA